MCHHNSLMVIYSLRCLKWSLHPPETCLYCPLGQRVHWERSPLGQRPWFAPTRKLGGPSMRSSHVHPMRLLNPAPIGKMRPQNAHRMRLVYFSPWKCTFQIDLFYKLSPWRSFFISDNGAHTCLECMYKFLKNRQWWWFFAIHFKYIKANVLNYWCMIQ